MKPFSTYPEDRAKLLALAAKVENATGNDLDDSADELADLVRAILTDEAPAAEEAAAVVRERDEARAYLKAFVYATIDPEDRKADVQVHQANPSLGWYFTLNDTGMRGHREILGSQIRRAMEIVGFDKLKIEPAGTTVADDLNEARRRCREVEATLAAQIAGHALTAKQSTDNLLRAAAAEKHRDALAQAGKHLAVKLAEVYRAAGTNPAGCQAIRDWITALNPELLP